MMIAQAPTIDITVIATVPVVVCGNLTVILTDSAASSTSSSCTPPQLGYYALAGSNVRSPSFMRSASWRRSRLSRLVRSCSIYHSANVSNDFDAVCGGDGSGHLPAFHSSMMCLLAGLLHIHILIHPPLWLTYPQNR